MFDASHTPKDVGVFGISFYVFLSLILRVNYQLVNSNRLQFENIFLGSERTIGVC